MVRSVPSEPVKTIAEPSGRPPASWFSSAATMPRQRPVDELGGNAQVRRRVKSGVQALGAERLGDLGNLQQYLAKLAPVRDRAPGRLLDHLLGIGAPHR